jgi:hypothetical protein
MRVAWLCAALAIGLAPEPPKASDPAPDSGAAGSGSTSASGLRSADTRVDHDAGARMCAGRSPCTIGLRYAGKDDTRELYVAELHLGVLEPYDCELIERWLVVDRTTTYRIGKSCDGSDLDTTWDVVDVDQAPPAATLNVNRTYVSRNYRRTTWFAVGLTSHGPSLQRVGETVDHPQGGNIERQWWELAPTSASPEGGAIVQRDDGAIETMTYRMIPRLGRDSFDDFDTFTDAGWKTTSLAGCAMTIGTSGRRLSALEAGNDSNTIFVEVSNDRLRTRGRVHLDVELAGDCEANCGGEPTPCREGWVCGVDVSLTTGKASGPAHVSLARSRDVTRLRVNFDYSLTGATIELVEGGGATARVISSSTPRHRLAPLMDLPTGLECKAGAGALTLHGTPRIP